MTLEFGMGSGIELDKEAYLSFFYFIFIPAAGSPTTTLLRLHPSYLPVLQSNLL